MSFRVEVFGPVIAEAELVFKIILKSDYI